MSPIEFEPRYSTKGIVGKGIRRLAKQELDGCLRKLLQGEIYNNELSERYEALVSFLKSPQSIKLRDVCEIYLSEGKQVIARICFWHGNSKYQIKLS